MEDLYNYMIGEATIKKIKELAVLGMPEKWSFGENTDNAILKNYLKYTFKRLWQQSKIIETDKYRLLNTGLFTEYYKSIYIYGEIYEPDDPDTRNLRVSKQNMS